MLGSKDHGHPDDPLAEAAKQAARLRGLDPLAALNELSEWLDAVKGSSGGEEKVRGEILSLIQEASGMHVSALLAPFLAQRKDKQATHESDWDTLSDFVRILAGALCASARILLHQSATAPALKPPAAAGAARGLHAARLLAKIYLLRYFGVPPKLWQLAYAVHGDAENAGCATTPAHLHAAHHHTTTTVTQELLGMLMLQSSSPDMLPPEQIEAVDRVIEQVGGDFTLRPRGAADNPFCFDPGSDRPPHRAPAQPPGTGSGIRYFGAGAGYDALDRLHKQLAAMGTAGSKASGTHISLQVQDLAIQHLRLFWGEAAPYSPPARKPAASVLQVVQGYGQVWQHLSHSGSGSKELSLVDDVAGAATQAPETWTLHDAGGNELGVEIPLRSRDRVRCGSVVCVTMHGSNECWLGTIRSLHAEPGRSLHANIYVMSRHPQALQLRAVIAQGEEAAVSESASRQFDFSGVRAIIVSDGAEGSQKANFMLAPDNWKEGRAYEATIGGATRFLRSQQPLRHGDDYVRAAFEWVQQA